MRRRTSRAHTLPVSLVLRPESLEHEFWSTSAELRAYYSMADKWTWLSATPANWLMWVQAEGCCSSARKLIRTLIALSILLVYLQRLAMAVFPGWYSRNRTRIIPAQRAYRLSGVVLMNSVRDITSYVELNVQRHANLLVASMATVLRVAALTHIIPGLFVEMHFPHSFRTTLFSSSLLSLLIFSSAVSTSMQVIHNAGLLQAAANVEQVLRAVTAAIAGIAHPRALHDPCMQTASALKLVLLSHVLGFSLPTWLVYCKEYQLKACFLAQKGVTIRLSNAHERALWAALLLMVSYLLALLLQPLGRLAARDVFLEQGCVL